MTHPDEFDRFYKDVRNRLLVLTYCLTGDLPSSRAAVRDAFVVCWHHWRKVSKYDDPEAWVRSRAWAQAQRRHTAKIWHRERGLDPEAKTTLEALGKLSVTRRKVLLLAELTPASMEELAREVGLPRAEAERELQTATAQLSLRRDVSTTRIRPLFEPVRAHVEDTRWPRATIIRRSGAARRRTHTVIGVAATIATLVVTGTLVSDAAGVHPTLAGDRVDTAEAPDAGGTTPSPEPVDIPEDSLLGVRQVSRLAPAAHWQVAGTGDNSSGDGLVMPCQESRYADSRSAAAAVRTFESRARPREAGPSAVQATEVAPNHRVAVRTYDTALGWFAGCDEERAQLIGTYRVGGVGDRAMLLELRTWERPAATIVAGVARTGRFTTTTADRLPGAARPDLREAARLLADAVGGLCTLPKAGACAGRPILHPTAPLPVGTAPSMLTEVDLPPLAGVDRPWVGTEPRQARENSASSTCDGTDFGSRAISNAMTRTFLIPGSKLPAQFGLTETVGALPEAKAEAFVAGVRDKLAACADKHMGTDVARVQHEVGRHRELTVWHLTTEISDDVSINFLMGIARNGTAVAQVGFLPTGSIAMAPGAFSGLVHRAQDRLAALPPPKRR